MAPGVHVAQIDSNKWAVTARGFNGRFANKLLVLVDGRTVYTPLFSGVFWDVEDLMREDVEQIEVVRGPGASVWGANAVNGVINIITRSAADSQGVLAQAGIGSEERGFASVRYGGSLGSGNGYYRLYAKHFDRDSSTSGLMAGEPNDAWHATRGGLRLDATPSLADTVTVHANVHSGRSGETVFARTGSSPFPALLDAEQAVSGANILGNWERRFSDDSSVLLKAFYSRTERDTTLFQETRSIIDVELQHRFSVGARHDLVVGAGYRKGFDDVAETNNISLMPASLSPSLASAFLQDEIALARDRVHLTVGVKFERSTDQDLEALPSLRVLWKPSGNQSVWGAVSRAVRTPSRAEAAMRINGLGGLLSGNLAAALPSSLFGLPVETQLWGSEQFHNESLVAYETGYRVQVSDQLSFDTAVYFNDYTDLRFLVPGEPHCGPQGVSVQSSPSCLFTAQTVVLPWEVANAHQTHTYGVEASADWRPLDWLRFQPAYTYFGKDQQDRPDQVLVELSEGQSPTHQLSLRQSVDIGRRTKVDGWLRYVDSLPFLAIDAYTTLDARVAWRVSDGLEVSIVGRNLFDDRHPEFVSEIGDLPLMQVERSVYVAFGWGL